MTEQGLSHARLNRDVLRTLTETGPVYWWALGLALAVSLVCFFLPWGYQLVAGVGVAGMNRPLVWGMYLSNFIFWIGLSHSGTLLSAVLHITGSPWRRAIYRSAEAMTLFSLMVAVLFVFVHVGRPWNIYWSLPYPNQRELWPNFRSPLLFDVTAITTYLTASFTFLFMGAMPDLAAARDGTTGWRKTLYTWLALGWRGTEREWHHLGWAYTFFAVLIIPLAVSVHSIVSWDFALSTVPGFHQTVFAPYFVVGAIYSGTAGIVTVMFLLRKLYHFEAYITEDHFDKLGRLLLVLSLLWTYINGLELFTGWYSGSSAELETLRYKLTGLYAPLYWAMLLFCAALPLVLTSSRVRHSFRSMLAISVLVNIGMYFERFLIIATSLPRKFLPNTWRDYLPTWVELAILLGSLAIFVSLFLIFVKLVPSLSIYEVKETLPHGKGADGEGPP
ncbi:MAG: polysulfide reductase NrfD [Gammaproteobacteria bacterium]|nr:polysulfide reductase NrfD [Gammaproteobacteria bacterium]